METKCEVCLTSYPNEQVGNYDGNQVCGDCVEYLMSLSDGIKDIANEPNTITNNRTLSGYATQ